MAPGTGTLLTGALAGMRHHVRIAYTVKVLALALAYFAAGKAGLALAYENSSVTAIWAPTGIALAALILWGRGLWPGVALGALLANSWTGVPPVTVFGITAGNTLEALVGATLLVRVADFKPSLERARDVIALAVFAAALSTMVSATIGVASLRLGGALSGSALPSVWRTWWLGDMGGDLLVAPFLLVFACSRWPSVRPRRLLEGAALLAALLGVSYLVFSSSSARAYLFFPILIWAALRFGQRAVTVSTLILSGIATGFTAHGAGPFVEHTPDASLLVSQGFCGISAVVSLLLAAVTVEREGAERSLRHAHRELEDRVRERTAQLTRSQAWLAEAQQLAHLGSWEWDVAADVVTWSDELYAIYGVSPDHQPSFADYISRVHPDDRGRVEKTIRDAYADHRPFAFDERILRPDGSIRTLSSRGEVFADGDGTAVRMLGVCQDVTERHRVQEALRQAEERFRGAFEEGPIGIALIDLEGRFQQVNKALCEITGYRRDDLEATRFDCIAHPDDMAELRRQLKLVLAGKASSYKTEKRFIHASGDTVWVAVQATLLRDTNGQPTHFLGQMLDITERRRYEERLKELADHDPLTGLLNRRSFERELESHLERGRRYGMEGAALVLDLDHFKYVNDSLGHSAGDELIVRVAHTLGARLRGADVLARLGGDEFAVLLPKADADGAQNVARDLLDAVRNQKVRSPDGPSAAVTASVGVMLIGDETGAPGEDVMVNADLAMYDAKEQGRDRIAFYTPDDHAPARIKGRMAWHERIREALDKNRFTLLAQPIIDLGSGRASQYELLLRMKDETGDLIPPGAFLSIAEGLGLVREIDRWVVRSAIGVLEEQERRGHALTVEVNLSGSSLGDPQLLELIVAELRRSGIPPERLIFEVTETAAVADMPAARRFSERLADLGCRFALDDFGAGFGSFYYLKHLPFDFLKIDGEFVRNCRASHTDRLLIQAVVDIARGLETKTIAEIVNDDETVDLLAGLGVDYGQGYYLGRPGPLEEVLTAPPIEHAGWAVR